MVMAKQTLKRRLFEMNRNDKEGALELARDAVEADKWTFEIAEQLIMLQDDKREFLAALDKIIPDA